MHICIKFAIFPFKFIFYTIWCITASICLHWAAKYATINCTAIYNIENNRVRRRRTDKKYLKEFRRIYE